MNVQRMLQVDRWLGVPVCFVLTRFRKLFSPSSAAPGEKAKSILFIKLAEQGSSVLAYLALENAVRRVGRENVWFLVFDDNRFIVDVLGLIPESNVLPIESGSLFPLLVSALKMLARIRGMHIGATIDLEFFARSSASLTYLSGAPVRIGFHAYFGEGPYRGDLMTHRIRYNPHLHTSQTFAMLVDALDVPAEKFPTFDLKPDRGDRALPHFEPEPREIAEVEAMLRRETALPDVPRLILLNANASDLLPLRRWEETRYVQLAKRLLARFPELRIAFTGAQNEAQKVDDLVAQVGSPRAFSLAGKTTLRQLLVLYALADVLVTNDSGPAHFASLTPVHTVTLFGPETPLLFAALTPRNKPLWAGIACSPCVSAFNNRRSACRDNVCMQRLTVDEVFAAVCASFEERHPPATTRGIRLEMPATAGASEIQILSS